MEIFLDFGLFELMAAIGLVAVTRLLYSRRFVGMGLLLLSVIAPLILLFVVPEGMGKWLAAITLGTSLVNATVVFGALKEDAVPRLLHRLRWHRAVRAEPGK